jgi:Phage derived protein Gp49-like (DUF891)
MLTSQKCMEPVIAYRGSRFTVEFASRADGSVPGLAFYNQLEGRWKARLLVLFKLIGDTGRVSSKEQFRKFADGFFEFKAFQNRMPCYFRSDKRIVVTHGFIKKKEGAAPVQEVERARTIQKEYERG